MQFESEDLEAENIVSSSDASSEPHIGGLQPALDDEHLAHQLASVDKSIHNPSSNTESIKFHLRAIEKRLKKSRAKAKAASEERQKELDNKAMSKEKIAETLAIARQSQLALRGFATR